MKKNTFKILFYLRGNQVNKEEKAPIMIRITVDGKIERLNAKISTERVDRGFLTEGELEAMMNKKFGSNWS